MRILTILLAFASLAACGSNPADPQPNQVAETLEAEAPAATRNAALPPSQDDNAASPTPGPTGVPAAFRGTWAESEAVCGDRSHTSRLVISERTLRIYESVMEVARVEQLGTRQINIIGTSTGEGTTRPSELHYSLDAAGNTLTDEAGGGMVRRRCGG